MKILQMSWVVLIKAALTSAALMGAVALGLALAFGLGGRDVAARLLESAYAKGQDVKDDVKQDIKQGVESGIAQAQGIAGQREEPGGATTA